MLRWRPLVAGVLLAGGASLATSASACAFWGPRRADIETCFQARGAGAERRIRTFRLAWDFVGSTLAGRGELYERFYLRDSFRMTALAYLLADEEHPTRLVERFLRDD